MTQFLRFRTAILAFIILALGIFLYQRFLNFYFFQDDFFLLRISNIHNTSSLVDAFKFRPDIVGYRPITINIYFSLSKLIFGLNPVAFRLITFTFFLLTFLLITKLFSKISKNIGIGLLTATFWLLSSIHFMSITWISASYQIFGTFFFLLTSLSLIKYLGSYKPFYYIQTLVFFLITLGSFEFAVTWPLLFGFFILNNNNLKKTIKILWPFFLIVFTYLFLRFIYIKVPEIEEYKFVISPEAVKTFVWYIFWTLNIPDEFKKQVVGNLIFLNEKFQIDFWQLILKSILGSAFVLILSLAVPIYRISTKKLLLNLKLPMFGFAWFSFTILPVLFLPNHNFLYYLTLPSIGIYFTIAYFLIVQNSRIVIFLAAITWFFTSFFVINFYFSNSWMNEAQKFAKGFVAVLENQSTSLPTGSTLFYSIEDKPHLQAVSGKNAFKLLFPDNQYQIYYNKEDLIAHKKNGGINYIYLFK